MNFFKKKKKKKKPELHILFNEHSLPLKKLSKFKAVSRIESLFHQLATYNNGKYPTHPGQMASHLQTMKPSCSTLPPSPSLGQPVPTPRPCLPPTTHTPSCSEGCREFMYHVQADVIETASPESAGETLGVSRELGRGQLSAPRSFQNAHFSGTEKEGRRHSNNWLWAVSNPV